MYNVHVHVFTYVHDVCLCIIEIPEIHEPGNTDSIYYPNGMFNIVMVLLIIQTTHLYSFLMINNDYKKGHILENFQVKLKRQWKD